MSQSPLRAVFRCRKNLWIPLQYEHHNLQFSELTPMHSLLSELAEITCAVPRSRVKLGGFVGYASSKPIACVPYSLPKLVTYLYELLVP